MFLLDTTNARPGRERPGQLNLMLNLMTLCLCVTVDVMDGRGVSFSSTTRGCAAMENR